ncbi:YmfQ family protein [Methylobacterium nodulans]|uniref:DUF2313 domain-containing protein n=1 Tax=Methylobacterium nodulans (strain LMG 21967 / CNCM I-2342 / ORS 2060) TaxID=460265 RepID=B8ICK2_METNO|nr:putative phage tail protein [Methylobacterium nodulans]ACL57413.1 conserved hypothetical protein [Methylobacterium nodulans ORS 2060]
MLRRLSVDRLSPTADATGLTADATALGFIDPPRPLPTADRLLPTVDGEGYTVDLDYPGQLPPGWPCAHLGAEPPSVYDIQAEPTAERILPQLLALTPRGPAWGTDEAGDGRGASPVMRQVWSALAAWVAEVNRVEFDLATQALPSAVSWALPDWEAELGLPDPCGTGPTGREARVAAVRARFAAQGGASPAYFICLAASIGYDITIEEPTQFLCDVSECSNDSLEETWFTCDEGECDSTPLEGYILKPDIEDTDQVSDETQWKYWVVHVRGYGETWFYPDEGECDTDPLEGFTTAQDLECLLHRYAPQHTRLIFAYSLAA